MIENGHLDVCARTRIINFFLYLCFHELDVGLSMIRILPSWSFYKVINSMREIKYD